MKKVSLVSRPRSVMGKASNRALSVMGPRIRRPLSAVPAVSFTEISRDKRRPYSADSQLLPSSYKKRNKLSACFSMSADPMGLTQQDIETDGDIEFSSSTLVSSQLSDQLGGAWMELEMRGFYLRHSDPQHPSSTDNGSDLLCSSEVSEDPTRSEKSLGEHIQAMARDHVNHDQTSSVRSHHDKLNEKNDGRSGKYEDEEETKNMSTRELHLRMVESGLISTSLSYSPPYLLPNSNYTNMVSSQGYGSINPEFQTSAEKRDIQKINENEFCMANAISKPGTASSDFWNTHREFYQAVNQSSSDIDQISFPKEHDVDSLGGDSSCSNNGPDSQRRAEVLTSPLVHSKLENQWTKSSLVPVRFQQWVTDSSRVNNLDPNSNRANLTSSFYYGVRSSHPQLDKSTVDHDCTVEEVSTDSEYSKSHLSSCEAEKGPRNLESNLIPATPNVESTTSTKNNEYDMLDKGNDQCEKDIENIAIKLTARCAPSATVEEPSNVLCHSKESINSLTKSKSISSDSLTLESKFVKRIPYAYQENGLEKIACSSPKSSAGSGRKVLNTAADAKKDLLMPQAAKRRIDPKGNGSSRKCGKGPSSNSNRNFSSPKEEAFPGETQTELISWMAICSENLMDNNCQTSKEPTTSAISSEDKAEDSPYNEIMTILRVLEEKEDENSLLRILNKRSGLRTPQDTSMLEDRPAVASPSCSSLMIGSDQNDRPLGTTTKALEAPGKVNLQSLSAEKQEINATPTRSATASSSNDTPLSQTSAQGELRDLLTFLDAVDQSCSAVLQSKPPSTPRPTPRASNTPVDSHNLEELLSMGRSDLAQEIITLRLALEDRDASINLLRTALREQKDSQTRQNAAHSAELETRIREVKSECEAVIKRHQKFIDQLISDKASLSQRCETLVQEAKESEEKHAKACKTIEEKHKVEMQRVKDITAATEKLKRERWVENKTQKIKELTVRGLEPELSRLTSQHEQEMSALRTLHAQELEQTEARAARRSAQQLETLREQLVQEKEDALTREREMLRQRIEKQQLLFEEEGAEQRRRLVLEVRREQDRLATLEARLEAQCEERKRNLDRVAEQEKERVRRDYADKLTEMHRKQQNEILQYRESLKAEKEAWVETYQQQQKHAMIQTSNEIREQLKRERDREIEVVIERLENEATISREEREKTAENRLRRVREQLTSELKDVESALNTLKEKHAELRSQLQEKEDKLVSSEALNRSLQTQIIETRKIADQLSAERADLKQTLKCELSHEMECLRQQLAEQHARHQQQLQILSEQSERERQTHQQELQQLFDRVKLAIAKKEEVVKVARGKQKAAEEQNSHLQALLERRRKESLMS